MNDSNCFICQREGQRVLNCYDETCNRPIGCVCDSCYVHHGALSCQKCIDDEIEREKVANPYYPYWSRPPNCLECGRLGKLCDDCRDEYDRLYRQRNENSEFVELLKKN